MEVGQYLRQNLEKISEHGSRADSIVKGMLEHTRTGGEGSRQLTDINKLCDQFMEISIQGMKNKWINFIPTIKKEYAENLPRIAVTAVDFSKLLVNLFNNALYAVHERVSQSSKDYVPTITISTNLTNNRLMISVKDNGSGIPDKVMGQIFNPFFTTKPTGDGAGLGLSISHDIVVSHGGTIICESEPGTGTVFLVSMPV